MREQQWAVEIDIATELADDEGGGHAQRRAKHRSYHQVHVARLSGFDDFQCGSQATAFVELDVDRIISADAAIKIGNGIEALVGAERNRPLQSVQVIVVRAGQGLFDQNDSQLA